MDDNPADEINLVAISPEFSDMKLSTCTSKLLITSSDYLVSIFAYLLCDLS